MAKTIEPVAATEHAATTTTSVGPYDDYAGKTMGIVALVLAFFTQIPALILGIIAWVWSKNAGVSNVPAKVAVAVSSGLIVLGLLVEVRHPLQLSQLVELDRVSHGLGSVVGLDVPLV